MNRKLMTTLQLCLLLIIGTIIGVSTGKLTTPTASALALDEPGNVSPLTPVGSGITYQGRLKNGNSPANGQYDFIFFLFDAQTSGTQVDGVQLNNQTVSDGLFTVSLNFTPNAFDGNGRWLDISVRPAGSGAYTTLTPRQPITPAPYALFALKTKGYQNVVTVAKSGGDFTSIQAALNSISGNSYINKFLVWVAPGIYTETVQMKMWVDIEGAGREITKITYGGSANANSGTIKGAANSSLRSLTVENTGDSNYAKAIYNFEAGGMDMRDLYLNVIGSVNNYGVDNDDSNTTMNDMYIRVQGPDDSTNYGVRNFISDSDLDKITISTSGIGGVTNYGIYNHGFYGSISNSTIYVYPLETSVASYGIYNYHSTIEVDNTKMDVSHATTTYGVYLESTGMKMRNSEIHLGDYFTRYGVFMAGTGGGNIVSIDNSQIDGGTNTIRNTSGFLARVSSSRLEGGSTFSTFIGMNSCAGVTDENNAFFTNTCP